MTPQAEELVIKVINEVNQKVLNETEQKGIKQGIEQNKLEIAKNMIDSGFSVDEIVKITGLTISQINSL